MMLLDTHKQIAERAKIDINAFAEYQFSYELEFIQK